MTSAVNHKIDAFQQLLVLEERVRLSGPALPKDADFKEQWAGINFTLAGQACVVRLDEVVEILVDKVPTRLPGCADWVMGVLNLRGRLLPVFALPGNYQPAPAKTRQESWQILVVERGKLFCGIKTDRVAGMEKYQDEDFLALDDVEAVRFGPLGAHARRVTRKGGSERLRLNLADLAGSLCALSPSAAASETNS